STSARPASRPERHGTASLPPRGGGSGRGGPVTRFLLRRLLLALVTLWLLSLIVFLAANLLPGDVGRRILGPFADPRAVASLNHRLGVDRPILVQYLSWLGGALHFDFGNSLSY